MSTVAVIVISFMICLIVIYLFLLMPRVSAKPDMAIFKNCLYAHRGLHDNHTNAPENSLSAFRRALNAGFGIELDVQLTKDRIPVIFHDFTLDRVCGAKGKVCDYTYEELQQFSLCGSGEKIPKLADVLDMIQGKVPLIVELKIERKDISLCPIADALLSDYKGLYCIESFNPLGLNWYRKNRGSIVRGQLSDAFLRTEAAGNTSGGVRVLYYALQNLLVNFLSRPDFISYNCKFGNNLPLKLCRKLFHAKAAAWTVKNQEELEKVRPYFDIFIFDSFLPDKNDR
ncbi:MAG: hypothetical protein NC094_10665 [Bacteroidales bacterium]|nr:glycerophosphodiester phosphodiesterase [Lachnoclostridium sp.]MCM1384980.1 glycerophosphodiester phosphodiesterase [Lachnoclostridium sp.]MCM1465868.1 hypothetical protein [Bacteroidales bacterium]